MSPDPDQAEELADLLDRRLLIVSGKGGVGKSTVSAALAVAAASAGKKTLLAITGDPRRYEQLFDGEKIGYRPREIEKNLFVTFVTPEESLGEYLTLNFKFTFIVKKLLANHFLRIFTTALPGSDLLLLIGKVYHDELKKKRGKPLYDIIVFDAPATGHLLTMLKTPANVMEVVRLGPLKKQGLDMQKLLTDSKRTGILIVSLAEEMPVNESIELNQKLIKGGFPIAAAVANAIIEAPGLGPEAIALAEKGLADPSGDCKKLNKLIGPRLRKALVECAVKTGSRRDRQRERLSRLQKNFERVIELPYIYSELSRRNVGILARRFFGDQNEK